MGKRGQITVFIVIGIVVLFAVGFVLYAASIQPSLRLFGEKESELQQYIGSCLETTAQEAIRTLGTTGGYIDVPEEIKINPRSYFSFAPNTEPKIPLWYYRGKSRIPSKQSIALNISKFISDNINSCLGNFDAFKDKYSLRLKGNATTLTQIETNQVSVNLNYPSESTEKQTGAITNIASISRNIDVKLGKMHDMAVEILKMEGRTMFFENITIDWLSSNPEFPFTHMEFSCKPKLWRKTQLVDFAKNMLYYNIQQMTVQGNSFALYDTNDIYSRNQYVMPMDKTYPDIGAMFMYSKEGRFDLHVRPNDREYLRSNVGRPAGSGVLSILPFCINVYHFTYDIDYPVLVELKDEAAFGGTGFMFNFAFPVTINHNQGDKKEIPLVLFESPDYSYDFCTTTNDNLVDLRVINSYTGQELYGVPLEFRCISYVCDFGETTSDGGAYRKYQKIPSSCSGGSIIARPEGYLENSVIYEGTDLVEIPVKPLASFKVNFVKHDSINLNKEEDMKPGEMVSLIITSLSDPGFEQIYSSETPEEEIQLIDGDAKYHIEAILVQDGERITGGYAGDWDATYAELVGKSTATFHLIQKIPVPVTEQEQGEAAALIFDDTTYQNALKPTFS